MDTIKINKHNTLLISDGGNQINEIDHTYPAILGACNKDYDGILVYVRFTKDRYIVCSRNRSLYRLIKKKIHISRSKYEELLEINFNKPFTYITKLEEVIDLTSRYHKKLIIKLCQPIGYIEINQLQELLKNYPLSNISIMVNDPVILNKFKRFSKDLKLIYEIDSINEDIIEQAKLNHFELIIPLESNVLSYLKTLRKEKIKIGIKDLNNPIDASIMINSNIDFITTKILE